MKQIEKAKKLVKIVLDIDAIETKDGLEFYFLGITYYFTSFDELSTMLQHMERWLNIDHNLEDINSRLDMAEEKSGNYLTPEKMQDMLFPSLKK